MAPARMACCPYPTLSKRVVHTGTSPALRGQMNHAQSALDELHTQMAEAFSDSQQRTGTSGRSGRGASARG